MNNRYLKIGNRNYAIPTKPFYQSKTLWIGILGIVIEILQLRNVVNLIDPTILAILIPALMIILRFITTQPLGI